MQNRYAIEQLIEAGVWISQKGWVPATGGNFSARTDSGFVVTASGYDKGQLAPEHFLQFDCHGQIESGTGKPSAETELHLSIYQLVADATCVLHTHSVAATVLSRFIKSDTLAITGYEMQKSLAGILSHEETLQIAIFDNDQDIEQLAEKVALRYQRNPLYHGVLIRGHGLYAWGRTPSETRRHLEGLEFLFACELERIKLEATL